jgi:hypothetical protein
MPPRSLERRLVGGAGVPPPHLPSTFFVGFFCSQFCFFLFWFQPAPFLVLESGFGLMNFLSAALIFVLPPFLRIDLV